MWAILYLILRTPTVVAPLNRVILLSIMSQLFTSIAGYPRPIVGVLASMFVVFGIVVPRRPLVRLLRVKVLLLIPLSFDFVLLIEVVISFLHRSFNIYHSVMQVHVRCVLMHQHPLLDIRIESGLRTVYLWPLINYKGRGEMGEFHEFGSVLQYAHSPLLQLHKFVLFCLLEGH